MITAFLSLSPMIQGKDFIMDSLRHQMTPMTLRFPDTIGGTEHVTRLLLYSSNEGQVCFNR